MDILRFTSPENRDYEVCIPVASIIAIETNIEDKNTCFVSTFLHRYIIPCSIEDIMNKLKSTVFIHTIQL